MLGALTLEDAIAADVCVREELIFHKDAQSLFYHHDREVLGKLHVLRERVTMSAKAIDYSFLQFRQLLVWGCPDHLTYSNQLQKM